MAQFLPRSPSSAPDRTSPSTSATSADGSSRKSFASGNRGGVLAARDLRKNFSDAGGRRAALGGLSFELHPQQTLVVLGPSGAGKTTLLRIVAGLERPDAGTLTLDGRDLLRVPAERRDVSLVVTGDALFPHMSVRGNLAFAMRAVRADARERDRRIEEIARALGIHAHLDQRPQTLSAGERRRAALARAFLREPRVLLLDEPFAHLDPQLRASVRDSFAQSRRRFAGGTILVTHDHLEALADADRLAVLIDGEIVQEGAPRDVYEFPADVRVATFFGAPAMNLLHEGVECIGIRPEHIRIDPGGELSATVARREEAGADTLLHLDTPRGAIVVRARAGAALPRAGDTIGVALPHAFVRRFDAQGRLLR